LIEFMADQEMGHAILLSNILGREFTSSFCC
jgi:rubrerythrin